MPIYRFAVLMGDLPPIMEERRLDDLPAAKQEATRLPGHSIFDVLDDFWAQGECRVSVADDGGLILFEVHAIAIDAPAVRHADVVAS